MLLAFGWIVFAHTVEVNARIAIFAVSSGLALAGLVWWNSRVAHEEHERFLMLTRATRDPVWDWNMITDEVWLSENIERAFGWSAGALANRQWVRERIHPDDAARVLESFEAAVSSGAATWTCEYRFLCQDGGYRDILQRALLVRERDGRPVRMIGTMLDLTQRIATERALRERGLELERINARLAAAEGRFRQVFEGTASGMLIVSPEGDISMVNEAAGEIFGYELEELVTLPIDSVLPPDIDGEAVLSDDSSAFPPITGGRHVLGFHKDGRRVPVELVLSPIEGDDGVMTIASVSDLTARRAAEAALRERNAELGQANAELARANAELERFAQVASHDLQEPLRTVSSFVQLLAKRYSEHLDDTGRRYINYAVDGAERMRALIHALLAYSRLERQEAPVDAEVSLPKIVARVQSDLHAAIASSHAEITSDELPVIAGNEGQLAQLLLNLIGNAIKYRRGKPPRIHVGASDQGDHWRISVADNGIGIEPKYFERIFVVFQRLHTREAYEGTGIGLALCKRIVERHGGRIWLESRPAEGSTFYFTMRKLADTPSQASAAPASAATQASPALVSPAEAAAVPAPGAESTAVAAPPTPPSAAPTAAVAAPGPAAPASLRAGADLPAAVAAPGAATPDGPAEQWSRVESFERIASLERLATAAERPPSPLPDEVSLVASLRAKPNPPPS